jgi:hypothetical protein
MPVRVELPSQGVGGYALPPLAVSVWVEPRLTGTPLPTLIGLIVADVVEVSADHQLPVIDLHRLCRTGRVLLPAAGAFGGLIEFGHKVTAPGREIELPVVVHNRLSERSRSRLGEPGGVVLTLGVELDQGLGRLAVHRIADASSPDRLAVGVELQVAVGRLAVVRAYGGVYLGLRFGPKLLAGGEVECRKAPPSAVDPPEFGSGQNRLQRKRVVVPSDHLPGIAVDQHQVALVGGGPREVARDQHVVTVDGHVEHLGSCAP